MPSCSRWQFNWVKISLMVMSLCLSMCNGSCIKCSFMVLWSSNGFHGQQEFLASSPHKIKTSITHRGVTEVKNLCIECRKSLCDLTTKKDPLRQIVVIHYKDYRQAKMQTMYSSLPRSCLHSTT